MSLNSISPIDARYEKYTRELVPFFSDTASIKYKIIVEGEYLIALSETKGLGVRKFTEDERKLIRSLYNLKDEEASIVNQIEMTGYKNIKATNHDFKAIEYYLKDKLSNSSLKDVVEFIHIGLTSEDASNIAYALMISDSVEQVMIPTISTLVTEINQLAEKYGDQPMLARTHGQPASPTTFGKEMRIFASRIEKRLEALKNIKIEAKLNGATGNYNALHVAYHEIDWPKFSENFIESFNKKRSQKLTVNLLSTQIESHDSYVAIFDTIRRINTVLLGFNHDMWRYISDGWLGQKAVEGEVGSSTMPHKINPWFLENSEGNLSMANAMFEFYGRKLPISRLQRDLSDSTVLRTIGTAFGHCLIGYSYLNNQLGRIVVSKQKMLEDLNKHPEVITEAIQTILRREGAEMPYEKLKQLSRGKEITLTDIHLFIDNLEISDKIKTELKKITPENYTGLASTLASM